MTSASVMAHRVEIAADAEVDLDACYRYIAANSPANALRWWQHCYDVMERLGFFPESHSLWHRKTMPSRSRCGRSSMGTTASCSRFKTSA
jgi:plasmid stabilization system protein ParE